MKKADDPRVREALHSHLLQQVVFRDAVIIDELALSSVDGRVDVVVVNSHLHGYEIKSDVDTLARLKRESVNYAKVLDLLTVVVTEKHLAGARKILPEFWGIDLFVQSTYRNYISPQREATVNIGQTSKCLAGLLWKDQALELLQQHDAAKGLRSKPKWTLHRHVTDVCSISEIRAAVIAQYKLHRRKRTG